MRNSLFFQIILVFFIFIFAAFIFLTASRVSLEDLLNKPIFFIFTLVYLTLMIFSAAYISVKFVKPIKKVTDNISQPKKLMDLFYSNPRLPSEIKRLLLSVIQYQTDTDKFQTDYLAERKMFNSLLENMKDGILITDETGNVTMINTSTRELFGIGKRNVIGSSLAEVLRNYKINELWQKCSLSQQQEMMTIEIAASKFLLQCIATPLAPELPGSILFLFQDLTRMKRLEIIRRDFISNVSHELRTPLASLKLIAETLHGGALQDPPAAKRFLRQMDNEVDNLTQMVEEILELSRIESGQVPLEKQWVKPCELINNAGGRMEMQANRAGLSFDHICNDALPSVFVDATRLSQVLINLMHNAIKFTPPGGEVKASAFKKGNNLIFFVKDTGVGIPQKDLERIFERFYKSDRSRSKHGTGLGLSISKHLVERHGGKIWAESVLRAGTTVKFSIPINRSF